MRRPQSAFGLAAVMAGLLVVLVLDAPAAARDGRSDRFPRVALRTSEATRLARNAPQARTARVSGDACTGWTSDRVPPPTIRVLRDRKRDGVRNDVVGTVQEVPFREYVGVVLAAEWPDHYPLETIKAGALAVKQYAWYYAIVYRGGEIELGDGTTACYDVVDTTVDQVYYPEAWSPSDKHRRAIDSTWGMTVRKYRARTGTSRFILTGYRDGESVPCGADATGWKLFQNSARRCGIDGLRVREILRTYLEPGLEIVTLGRHDIIGTERGDASAFVRNEAHELVAHVWTPGSAPPDPGSRVGVALASGGLVGALSSDVDEDGRDDLLWLRDTGPSEGRFKVARSNGVDYGETEDWYAGPTGGPLAGAFVLSGDFNGDERQDAAILAHGAERGKAALYVFKGRPGPEFRQPGRWWAGSLDLDRVRDAWAGDVNGDGRADLIVREDLDGGGLRIRIALARRPSPGMLELRTRFTDRTLRAGRTLMVPGDANRDGREDLLLVTRDGNPGRVERLQGRSGGGLRRVRMWTAPSTDPIVVRETRVGSADVDYDGRTDLLLFTVAGDGTRIRVLRSRYASMRPGPDVSATSIDWHALRPY